MYQKNEETGSKIALAVILIFLAALALLAGSAGSKANLILLPLLMARQQDEKDEAMGEATCTMHILITLAILALLLWALAGGQPYD